MSIQIENKKREETRVANCATFKCIRYTSQTYILTTRFFFSLLRIFYYTDTISAIVTFCFPIYITWLFEFW